MARGTIGCAVKAMQRDSAPSKKEELLGIALNGP